MHEKDQREHHHEHQWDETTYERIGEMREKLIDMDRLISFMKIKRDETIIDVGSGDGYYSIKFSKYCKNVVSLDKSKSGNELEKRKIENERVKNVVPLIMDICESQDLPVGDRIFFSTSFHDFPCKEEIVKKFTEGTKPYFTLIEFKKDSDMGPPKSLKLSPQDIENIFQKFNYELSDIIFFREHYAVTYIHKN